MNPEQAVTGFLPQASLAATCLGMSSTSQCPSIERQRSGHEVKLHWGMSVSHNACADGGMCGPTMSHPRGLCSQSHKVGRRANVT